MGYDPLLTELDQPKAVAEEKPQPVFFRPEQIAAALGVPLAAIRAAVQRKRLKPDGYLVIDQDKFEPLFEAGCLDLVRGALNPAKG